MTTPTAIRPLDIAQAVASRSRRHGFQAVAAHLVSCSDAELGATAELLAKELHRRGMLPVLADIAHEVALEAQPGHALAATAAALDAHHNLGGVA